MKKKTKKIISIDGENAIKITFSTVVYTFLIAVVLMVAIGSVLAYGTNTQIGGRIAAKISKVIPFPAAIIKGTHVVYLSGLESNLNSVKQFYQTQKFSDEGLRVDFSTEIGQKRLEIKKREILDKMVEDEIIRVLAAQKKIEVSEAEVDEAVNAKLNEYGTSDQVKADLQKSYGWNMDDFKNRVVLPNMYAQALAKQVEVEQNGNTQAKSKIEKAQSELKSGTDFAVVAQRYSDGSSKENSGELGWVKKDQVIPELAETIFANTAPEKNAIIESPIGFHIVEIEEKKKENDQDVLRLRQIFVSKNTFADWLQQQKKNFNVWVPMKEFVWDKQSGIVQFRDEQMKKFESEQRKNAQGDASLML